MRSIFKILGTILCAFALLSAALSAAASTYDFSYSGRLVDKNGKPHDGPVSLRASFYHSASGGSSVLDVTTGLDNVVLNDGVFQITLALDPQDFHSVFPSIEQATYIQITDLTHNKAYSRQQISMLPYAGKIPIDESKLSWNSYGELTLVDSSVNLGSPGAIGATTPSTAQFTTVVATAPTTASTVLTIKGLTGQSANLSEWKNASGTTLAAVDAAGTLKFTGGTAFSIGLKAPATLAANFSYTLPVSPVAGAYLSTDANGVMSWVTSSSSVDATGLTGLTQGSVPFAASSGLAEDNANLFWDDTNNRLGIGTTTPAAALDVYGNIKLSNMRTYALTRTLPTTVNSTVDIGSLNIASKSAALTIKIATSGFGATKIYQVPLSNNQTGTAWHTVMPINAALEGSDDFALEAQVNNAAATFRLRRSAGTTAGTAYITILHDGVMTDAFTASTDTNSGVSAASGNFNATLLSMSSGGIVAGGPLTLFSAPTVNLHAATKQYVDDLVAAGVTASSTTTLTGKTIDADNNTISNISNTSIKAGAAIEDTKLATISTAGKVSGAAITSGTIAGSTAISTSGDIATTGKVGIGGAAGTSKLEITGSGATSATSALNVMNSTPTSLLFVRNDGNVGIGTTSPGNKLTVTSPTTSDALADVMIGTSATTQKGLVIQAKASQTANLQEWQNSSGSPLIYIRYDGALMASSSPTATFSAVSVGSYMLGGVQFLDALNSPTTGITMHGRDSSTQASGNFYLRGGASGTTNANGGNLYFDGGAKNGTGTDGNIILASTRGNVGIGTTTPTAMLDMASGGNLQYRFSAGDGTGALTFTNSSYSGNIASANNLNLQASTNGVLTLTAAGTGEVQVASSTFRLGIGNSSSGVSKTIMGQSVSAGYTNSAGGSINFSSGLGTGNATGSNLNFLTPDTLASGTTQQTASTKMSITQSGNVGIGTTTPSQLGGGGTNVNLQVHSAGTDGTSFGNLLLTTASTGINAVMGAFQFGSTGLSGSDKRTAIVYSNKLTADTVNPTGDLIFATANAGAPATRMRIDQSGNVGIGTTSPASRLSVTDITTVQNRGILVSQHTSDAAAAVMQFRKSRGTESSPTTVANGDYTGGFTASNHDGTAFRINGNFGYKTNAAISTNNIPGEWYIAASSTNDTDPYTNGTVRMVVKSSGNVGIGTTSPNYKLTVNGEPGANGYTAFTNYSDRRLKRNIEPIADGILSKILKLKPSSFNYNELSGYDEATRNRRINGFIAQDLRPVFPEMVHETKINGKKYYDTNLSSLQIYLVKAMQELKKYIDSIFSTHSLEIAELKAQSAEKDQEIQALKASSNAMREVLCDLKPEAPFCTE